MNTCTVADIKTNVVDISVTVVVMAQYISYGNVISGYCRSEFGDLSRIMRQADAVIVRIYVRYIS